MPADTPEALLDERLQDLQEIWTRRESPQQITSATYLAVDEALHTEPVYLKNILHTPSTTTTHSDEDEISSIAFEGIAAYSHSFLHERLADVDVDGYLRQPPTKDNVEVVVIESYLIKDFKKFNKSKSECEKKLSIEKELNSLLFKEIVDNKEAVLAADLREL